MHKYLRWQQLSSGELSELTLASNEKKKEETN